MIYFKEIKFTQVIDEKVSLSPINKQDSENLYQEIQQHYVYLARWCPWIKQLNSYKNTSIFFDHYNDLFDQNKYFRLGIYYESCLKGWSAAFDFNWREKSCFIGYWISPIHQKKGYISYTTKFMISLLSELFSLKTFYLLCYKNNFPSRGLANKLGFQKTNSFSHKNILLYKFLI